MQQLTTNRVDSSSLKVMLEWTGNVHFCTIWDITSTFLVAGH